MELPTLTSGLNENGLLTQQDSLANPNKSLQYRLHLITDKSSPGLKSSDATRDL